MTGGGSLKDAVKRQTPTRTDPRMLTGMTNVSTDSMLQSVSPQTIKETHDRVRNNIHKAAEKSGLSSTRKAQAEAEAKAKIMSKDKPVGPSGLRDPEAEAAYWKLQEALKAKAAETKTPDEVSVSLG